MHSIMEVDQEPLDLTDSPPRPVPQARWNESRRTRGISQRQPWFTQSPSRLTTDHTTWIDQKQLCLDDLDRSTQCYRANFSSTAAQSCGPGAAAAWSPVALTSSETDAESQVSLRWDQSIPGSGNTSPDPTQMELQGLPEPSLRGCESDDRVAKREHEALSASMQRPQAFACPFHKYNPSYYNPRNNNTQLARSYRTCAGPGWDSTHRLKEHLNRAHKAEISP